MTTLRAAGSVQRRPRLLAELVTAAAERAPTDVAVRSSDGSLTYEQLAQRCDALASLLASHGVRRGDRVGLYQHKSVAAFLAVHAVLRAGAAYVPIDPFAPPAAVAAIITDCEISVLISDARLQAALEVVASLAPGLRVVVGLDNPIAGVTVAGADALAAVAPLRAPKVLTEDLAYVMYTSGSTGRPKGLMHTQRSGLRYAELAAETYGLCRDDRLANSAPFHFDISTFEIFAGPLAGSCSLIIAEPYLKLPASLSQLVAEERATVWYSVPFLLSELLTRGALAQRDLRSLRWVLFGGEVADPRIIAELMTHMPNARFSNSYGPAEVNQCSFHHLPGPPPLDETIPIGRPWADAEFSLLDEDLRPVPIGEPGELFVRTSTMMDGYWGREDLNAAAFVHVPMAGGRSARWYRTGDLARRRADGNYEFLGRRDHQVKVRGNRVELESVEAMLCRIAGIEQAVAAVTELDGTTALVAGVRVSADCNVNLDEARHWLATQLPPYAVPHRMIILDTIPLTASGKLDRRSVRQRLTADPALHPRQGVPQ